MSAPRLRVVHSQPSVSDRIRLDEFNLCVREARRYLAGDKRFLAGEWAARARSAVRRLHDQRLKDEKVLEVEQLEMEGTLADAGVR